MQLQSRDQSDRECVSHPNLNIPFQKISSLEASYEGDGTQLFVSRFQTRFVPDPTDRLEMKTVKAKEPDRVIGLRATEVFRQLASAPEGLRLSPFRNGNVLFPFLIIEAKSEKGGPGFESIENQAAFPIRALLKLQHDLSSASRSGIIPLVWFLANQGDEWRVYGGVVDNSKWVRSLDGAE